MKAKKPVNSDTFLVGSVPGWGTCYFYIELYMSKTSSDVGVFLVDDGSAGDPSYPLDISGSSFSISHGENVIFSFTFPDDDKITKRESGLGVRKALVYEKLKSMQDADDSSKELFRRRGNGNLYSHTSCP